MPPTERTFPVDRQHTCNCFTHAFSWPEIVRFYGLTQPEPPAGWPSRHNLAPSQDAPVIRLSAATSRRELTMMRWGLVPRWSGEPTSPYSMINARAETVATRPEFRDALRERRCLVPASGFYGWRQESGGTQPYHVCRADGAPMAFAGLWERWRNHEAGPLETFAIIVADAAETATPFQHRIPVIIGPRQWNL